jgi:hypothetical protein
VIKPRERRIEMVKCWQKDCNVVFPLDRDLQERVSTIPVVKAYDPRGVRVEPLLLFPPLFYWLCEFHRNERFGYRDMYDALAYLVAESRSSGRRLMVTEATLRDIGLDDEDIRAIMEIVPRWIGHSASPRSP